MKIAFALIAIVVGLVLVSLAVWLAEATWPFWWIVPVPSGLLCS